MACSSEKCSCSRRSDAGGSMTGRTPRIPPRDYWPNHDRAPLTDFVSERHKTATMWKL
jgi:hypothetical protein